jgi:uncharacterized membrane-anchored protein
MSGPYSQPTDTKEIENLLRELKKPHWMNWLALGVSILALVVAILAWQKPVTVNVEQPVPHLY